MYKEERRAPLCWGAAEKHRLELDLWTSHLMIMAPLMVRVKICGACLHRVNVQRETRRGVEGASWRPGVGGLSPLHQQRTEPEKSLLWRLQKAEGIASPSSTPAPRPACQPFRISTLPPGSRRRNWSPGLKTLNRPQQRRRGMGCKHCLFGTTR